MSRTEPRVFSIAPGVPFLAELTDALLGGRLIDGFADDGDPLRLADVTIFVPTRRAARALRAIFTERATASSAILPVIRPLGEFDEDAAFFETGTTPLHHLAPPIDATERLLRLAPLVRAWKRRLPTHVAAMFGDEPVTVPATFADAIWLARDLAALVDEVETEGADWAALSGLVEADLAGWWQVTLDFLAIVTEHWPHYLDSRKRANPATHRNALIDAEVSRMERSPPKGPVVAAGSTGSIPATSRLLAAIAHLPQGAVVLPGLDQSIDAPTFELIGEGDASPSAFGHPQYGLKKLLSVFSIERGEVIELGTPAPDMLARAHLVSEALRPAETTDLWVANPAPHHAGETDGALAKATLIEAANEREEALAIAVALRAAIEGDGRTAALVTGDRNLARRVSADLLRFGIRADDSGGMPLAATPAAALLQLIVDCVFAPGDPMPLIALLKHPLVHLGTNRAELRETAEYLELVLLRGGTGRPDIAHLPQLLEKRLDALTKAERPPFWWSRITPAALDCMQSAVIAFSSAIAPLAALRTRPETDIQTAVVASVQALEAITREQNGAFDALYAGDNGAKLAEFLRALVATDAPEPFGSDEWPAVLRALMQPVTVKPSAIGDERIAIWGHLEARLQHVDTLVLGGLNEGNWPRLTEPDQFMSRVMRSAMGLAPPERRIGLAAHDFQMAMGVETVILTRSERADDAPSIASRWLQRLTIYAGGPVTNAMRARGRDYLNWARALDQGKRVPFARRPAPRPPLEARPKRFSVTDVETLRRDPYAIFARKILRLQPLDGPVRDPGAAERGSLFHDILHRFTETVANPNDGVAEEALLTIGRELFNETDLPPDIDAVWWPRFIAMAPKVIAWERDRIRPGRTRFAEIKAATIAVGPTGVLLSGRADRIDLNGDGTADILDYKTGSQPSPKMARTLVSPQLALEAALMSRGGFGDLGGAVTPAELAYVRLKPDGDVAEQSILKDRGKTVVSAPELSDRAWERLGELIAFFQIEENGYTSRTLPFQEGNMEGDYDHLARVLEWSAGGSADGEDA